MVFIGLAGFSYYQIKSVKNEIPKWEQIVKVNKRKAHNEEKEMLAERKTIINNNKDVIYKVAYKGGLFSAPDSFVINPKRITINSFSSGVFLLNQHWDNFEEKNVSGDKTFAYPHSVQEISKLNKKRLNDTMDRLMCEAEMV